MRKPARVNTEMINKRSSNSKRQQSLFDGRAPYQNREKQKRHEPAETSRDAFRQVKPKLSQRALGAEPHLIKTGKDGLIRHQLAAQLAIAPHGAPSIAKRLLDAGLALKTDRTRETRFGGMAEVLIHVRFKGRQAG